MQSPIAAPLDDNASARQFAQSLSEEELFQHSQGRYFGRRGTQAEGDTQRLAFNWLSSERQRSNCNIYIPEVYKIFSREGRTFIIMQLLEAITLLELERQSDAQYWESHKSIYNDWVVEGIQLLRRMPVPSDATPGPYTSSTGRIRHVLFKDSEASITYNTVEELQDHLNRVAEIGYRNVPEPPRPATVTLEKELVFCYTDFNEENFLFSAGADGRPRLYIVDFEHASFLPLSFLAFAVLERSRFFLREWIADRIGSTLPRDNLEVMKRIRYMFGVCWGGIGLTPQQLDLIRSL